MAYKCKSCGYRFKSTDTDLCPECFTAREDISCVNIGGAGHTHFKDSSSERDSFIEEQLREESKLSGDEFREQVSSYTDEIKRSFSSTFSGELPPNTYERTPQRTAPPPVRYPQYQTRGQYQARGMTGSPALPQTQLSPKAEKKVTRWTVIIILLISAYMCRGTISEIYHQFREMGSIDEYERSVTEPPAETPAPEDTQQPPAASPDSIISDVSYKGQYLGYIDPAEELDAKTIYASPELTEYVWYAIECNITLPKEDSTAYDIKLSGVNSEGKEHFSWQIVPSDYGTGSKLYGVPLCFPLSESYQLEITTTDGTGTKEVITINPELTRILEEVRPADEGDPEPKALKFSYDYVMGSYETNMTDKNGSGYKMKLSAAPVEFSAADAKGTLRLEDSSLSETEMKLCKVETYLGKKTASDPEYIDVMLIGFDANGVCAYVYSAEGTSEIPISSRIRDYQLLIVLADERGFTESLDFTFMSNDLYNSLG